MPGIQEINERFAIPGVAELIAGRGGLPAVWVQGNDASQRATGMVYLHGGHVAAWKPAHADEVLWLSEKSIWQEGKPIRGGVPLCFPWFGPNKANAALPGHGFVRLHAWTLESLQKTPDGIQVTLATQSDAATRAQWPHDFQLRHRVTFGRELVMALELVNTGKEPFTAEEAQHTYFSVGDIHKIAIKGLEGVTYLDKADQFKEKQQAGDIAITGETDRVYLDTTSDIEIVDPVKKRTIRVHKEHSDATVVWNPWIAKAKAMADFGDEEWHTMLCVETCNVARLAVTLAPGQRHTMTARISVTSQ